MPASKQYGKTENYEKKLQNIMAEFGAEHYNYDWTRHDCFIEFSIAGQMYRFEHSIEKAKATGQKIAFVSDLFAQLVLALQDLLRLKKRGIYELSIWLEGMKLLPPPKQIADCYKALGFTEEPLSEEDIKRHYTALAKVVHPDVGGNAAEFDALNKNYLMCKELFTSQKNNEN